MRVHRVKVGAGGRLTLPAAVRKEMGLQPGDRLTLAIKGGVLVLARPHTAGDQPDEEFVDWSALAETSFRELWDDPANDAWDEV